MRVLFGPETIPYGTPDGYVIQCSCPTPDGKRLFMQQCITTTLLESTYVPWHIIGFTIEYITKRIREAGGEPLWWACGGMWMSEDDESADAMRWSPEDEFGDFIW